MNKFMLNFALVSSIVVASSTVCAETKKVNLSAGLNYLLSQVATKGDNNQSNHNMGMLYFFGKNGVPQDHKKAAQWFTKAANKGYAPSQYALSVMYINGDGVSQDTEKGVILLQSAAAQGQPDAVKLYKSLQTQVNQMNVSQTASSQVSIIAAKYYDKSKLEPKNFKQVVLPNLDADTIARSFYKVTSLRERKKDDYWGQGNYYFVNQPINIEDLKKAVISVAPIFIYQTIQGETRYLIPVEITQVDGNRIETAHFARGTLELFLFKKLENGQFQMVSKTAPNGVQSIAGYGRTVWDAQEFRKNLQAFGKNILGSYLLDIAIDYGSTQSIWSLFLLHEDDYIADEMLEGGESSAESKYEYYSTIKVIKNGQSFYPFQVQFDGTNLNKNGRVVKVNKLVRYEYDVKERFYSEMQ
jgi:hypothetical protein